jgi:2-polyprenyl-3-methyl-5-hydroxy-6-metoxy-1,4-benzoquinol methylase
MSDAPPRCGVCGGALLPGGLEVAPLDDATARYRIARCAACSAGRTVPWPSAAALHAFYDGDYVGGTIRKFSPLAEWLRDTVARRRARRLVGGLRRPPRVLDVGCGDGKLAVACAARGAVAIGLEGTRGPARQAAVRLPGRALVGEPAALPFSDQTFDLVVIWHVLEHLAAPAAVIAEAARCLRPGGRLVVAVPNVAGLEARIGAQVWIGLDVPRHLHHFTPAALRRVLDAHGFVVTRTAHFNVEMSVLFMIDTMLRRLGLARFSPFAHMHAGCGRRWQISRTTAAVTAAVTAILLVPALLLCTGAVACGQGGDVQIFATRSPEAERRS